MLPLITTISNIIHHLSIYIIIDYNWKLFEEGWTILWCCKQLLNNPVMLQTTVKQSCDVAMLQTTVKQLILSSLILD